MDVVAYLRILRRHWRMIVIAGVVGAIVGVGSTLLGKETASAKGGTYYKATTTLFYDTSNLNGDFRPFVSNLDQMAVLLVTGDVPQRVAQKLGGDPKELAAQIFVTTNGTLSTLDITATDKDQQRAEELSDSFADELAESIKAKEQARIDQTRDETLKKIADLKGQIDTLDAQIAATPGAGRDLLQAQRNSLVNQYTTVFTRFQNIANADTGGTNLSTLQAAESEPISRSEYDARITAGQLGNNRVRADAVADSEGDPVAAPSNGRVDSPFARGLVGAVLGLLIGVGIALVSDRMDRRLRSREEFEGAYGMPVLAEIPALKSTEQRTFDVVSRTAPFSRAAEAYRAVRSSLLFQRPNQAPGQLSARALTIMVASANPKEGKSTTSANLATVFAENGQRVLVMNCDFRRPTLHKFFGVENEPRRVIASDMESLMLVSDVTGDDHPNPAYVTDQQRQIIQNSQEHFEVVILDTAPLLSTNDATELMSLVDLVVVVGRVGETTSDNALRVRELLARIDAPAAGVVMVGSDTATNDYYYYYSRSRAKDGGGASESAPSATPELGTRNGKTNGNGNGAVSTPKLIPESHDG